MSRTGARQESLKMQEKQKVDGTGGQRGEGRRAAERAGSEQFVWIRDAGEINPALARRQIITLSLGATSIERASLVTRFLSATGPSIFLYGAIKRSRRRGSDISPVSISPSVVIRSRIVNAPGLLRPRSVVSASQVDVGIAKVYQVFQQNIFTQRLTVDTGAGITVEGVNKQTCVIKLFRKRTFFFPWGRVRSPYSLCIYFYSP